MLDPTRVRWVGEDAPPGHVAVPERRVVGLLGTEADAVVLEPWCERGAELLAQAAGLVREEGALVLRFPPATAPPPPNPALAVFPFEPPGLTTRFRARLARLVETVAEPPFALPPPRVEPRGTEDQARAVTALTQSLSSPAEDVALDAGPPPVMVLLADRGRGKSSALGLALAELVGHRLAVGAAPLRVLLAAPEPAQCAEVVRFAGAAAPPQVVAPEALPDWPDPVDLLIVDEAARLPVPLLRAVAARFHASALWMATTTGGYEGTGRGFVVRFLEALRTARTVREVTLTRPIRWADGDRVERAVSAALGFSMARPRIPTRSAAPGVRVERLTLDGATLAGDERRLEQVFALLRDAHYRTTPGDLERLLDGPNLLAHALEAEGELLAACLVAREGSLPAELAARCGAGAFRLRGHALADTLMTHSARPAAGELALLRSVRIAVHPEARRRGLARLLVEHVHACHTPDLFGTLFGATPELLRFRQRLGYRLVRLGITRGARSGEPSVVMIRPVTPAASALVEDLTRELAWSLPTTLRLLRGRDAVTDPALEEALAAAVPAAAEPDSSDRTLAVRRYLGAPQPFELAAWALGPWAAAHRTALEALAPSDRALIQARVLEERPWDDATRSAGFATVAAAQRALRPALGRLYTATEGLPLTPPATAGEPP